ncbi:MAG: hypothetical protein ACE5GU_15210 [Candidatus Scalinduaceae bacterium]
MEKLKLLDELCEPDERQKLFVVFNSETGDKRSRKLEDVYAEAKSIKLHSGVPEEIRSHFNTARNLLVYSWFFYPFNVTAQLLAFISVEFALKEKTCETDASFKKLLKLAVKKKWINEKGFSHIKVNDDISKENHLIEKDNTEAHNYCDALVEAMPKLRNALAHGNDMLHNRGYLSVRICADFINQLFSESKGDN